MSEAPAQPYVVLVCTGNTCRSPMAQKLLEHALAKESEPLKSLKVLSAGIGAIDGERASRNSVEALRKVGLSLENHSSRRMTEGLARNAFAIFAMTRSHLRMLDLSFDHLPKHVHLMREFAAEAGEPEIPDPYGGNLAAYEACRDSMVETIPGIVRFLREELGVRG